MKPQAYVISITLLLLIAVTGVGCAKSGSGFALAPTGQTNTGGSVVINPGTNTGTNTGSVNPGILQFSGQAGAAVTLTKDSLSALNTYVATHPLNNPQYLTLHVNMSDIGGGKYAGTMKITYQDNGSWYTGVFETGTGYNQISYKNIDTGKSEAEFNRWFTFEGKSVFHAFFQDRYGAVMLVIDKALNLGDGEPATYVGGSIWFKNFPNTYATQSSEKCWFIRIGPFDCRTFVVGAWDTGVIQTTSALYPGATADGRGYQRLGTFNGLERARAFNQ